VLSLDDSAVTNSDLGQMRPVREGSLVVSNASEKKPDPIATVQLNATGVTGDEILLADVWRILWRRKAVVIGFTVLSTVLTILLLNQLVPRYTAEALVLVDSRKLQVVDNVKSVLSGLEMSESVLASEVEILRSRRLIGRVVDELKLVGESELNPALLAASPGLLGNLRPREWLPTSWAAALLGTPPSIPDAEEAKRLERANVVSHVLDQLKVQSKGNSLVIAIGFETETPETAANVANAIADAYIVEQLETKFEATRVANTWLESRLGELRQQVSEAESAVESYRRSNKLMIGERASVQGQQLTEVNSQLIVARAEAASAQARLREAQELIRTKGVDAATEVITSPLIQTLRGQEAEVVRRLAELSTRYGERHPSFLNVNAELRDLRAKIEVEVDRIVRNLSNQVEVARARERSLSASLEQMRTEVASANQAEVKLRALEREAEAGRTLLETFLNRFRETSNQPDLEQPDARIITRAEVPISPSWPNKRMIILLVVFMSAAIGVVLAFIIEHLDNSFRGLDQLEAATGVSALGLVPELNRAGAERNAELQVTREPISAYAEAHRSVLTSIELSAAVTGDVAKTILIVSSMPSEGKSTLCLSLAQAAASLGKRAVVIEGDMRRPRIARLMKVPDGFDLFSLLRKKEIDSGDLYHDEQTNVTVIPTGKLASTGLTPQQLLASSALERLVADLRERFDLVFIDSPPALAVSDPRVLARLCDRIIYVVRWGVTPRKAVVSGIRLMSNLGPALGVVLSRVNARKHARYGYGDSTYYGSRYSSYYTAERPSRGAKKAA